LYICCRGDVQLLLFIIKYYQPRQLVVGLL
jgi:hypothetical protein